MESKTKWIIAISSAIGVGAIALLTKKYWMPSKTKSLTNGGSGETELTQEEIAARAAQAKADYEASNKAMLDRLKKAQSKAITDSSSAAIKESAKMDRNFDGDLSNTHLIDL